MKALVLCAGLLVSFSAFASVDFETAGNTIELRASEHTCAEMAHAIRYYGKVFIRMGFGGRSFRYPPYTCGVGEKYASIFFRDMNHQGCTLDYACVNDPSHNR